MQNEGWLDPSLPYIGTHIGGSRMVSWNGKECLSKSVFSREVETWDPLAEKGTVKSISCRRERIV